MEIKMTSYNIIKLVAYFYEMAAYYYKVTVCYYNNVSRAGSSYLLYVGPLHRKLDI